jgi:hypothetical protein
MGKALSTRMRGLRTHEGKGQLGKSSRRLKGNIKVDIYERALRTWN